MVLWRKSVSAFDSGSKGCRSNLARLWPLEVVLLIDDVNFEIITCDRTSKKDIHEGKYGRSKQTEPVG